MSIKMRNVFISHHGKDDEYITKFRELIKKSGYELRNSSIDSTKPNDANSPDYIKSILRPRIEWASVTVVLIGHETANREWVDWEIEYANKLGKRIVGVFLPGATDADLPDNLDAYADAILGWRTDGIVDAIEGANESPFENADGSPRAPRDVPRDNC